MTSAPRTPESQAAQDAVKALAERYRDDLTHAVRETLLNAQGRQVLWWIIEQCGIYQVGPIGNSGTNVHQGERNVGLKIINLLESVEPTAYPRLHLEMVQTNEERRRLTAIAKGAK